MAPGQSPLKPLMKQIRRVASLRQRLGTMRETRLTEYRLWCYQQLLAKRNVLADYEQRKGRVRVLGMVNGEEVDPITDLLAVTNTELQNRYNYLRELLGDELLAKYVADPDLVYDSEEWLEGSGEEQIKNQVVAERLGLKAA